MNKLNHIAFIMDGNGRFKLIKNYFSKEIKSIIQQDIKINILGEIQKFSSDLKSTLSKKLLNLQIK